MVSPRAEAPVNLSRSAALGTPLREYSSVCLDILHGDLGGNAIHFPVPRNVLACFQPSTAPCEPELSRYSRVDKCPKHFRDRSSYQHLRLDDRSSGQSDC